MWDSVQARIEDLARRAGFRDVSPKLVLVLGLVLMGSVVVAVLRFMPASVPGTETADARDPVAGTTPTAAATSVATSGTVYVHVVGAVRHPGVVRLRADSRVADAIGGAGGALGSAALEGVNLARPVSDGEQIIVPTAEEWKKARQAAPPTLPAGPQGAASAGAGAAPGAPIDINTADAAMLDTLPGVGPATAAKIIADREANGPFASVEDLGRVTGIGPRKLEAMKGLIEAR